MARRNVVRLTAPVWILTLSSCAAGTPQGVCTTTLGEAVPSEGWTHTTDDVEYQHNPPASGPHAPIWAAWGAHDDLVPRENWVHNLEHGGVVFLFRPDADEAAVAELRAAFDALPDDLECGHKRAVLTADPELDGAVAVVVADRVLEGDFVTKQDALDFATACRNHAREDVCA